MSCIPNTTTNIGKLPKAKKKKKETIRDNKILDAMEWWNNLSTEGREKKILLLYIRGRSKNVKHT